MLAFGYQLKYFVKLKQNKEFIYIKRQGQIYTYIIGHYNPSVRIIHLFSHTTYVVCANFIHKWRDLQFKVDSERQIFWETFHGNIIYSQSFCQKSAKRKSRKKYFSYFVLMSGAWDSNPGFSSNKPLHYLLDHGDLNILFKKCNHRTHIKYSF